MDSKTRRLNKLNNKLDTKIHEENQEIFTDMICYLRGSDLSEYDIEMVRHDLTDMVLSAQERGETINSVIGDDYKGFCDEVIDSLPPRSALRKVVDGLDTFFLSLTTICAINIIVSKGTIEMVWNAVRREPVDFDISISGGSILSAGVIMFLAYLIVRIVMRNSLANESNSVKIVMPVIAVVLIILLSAMVVLWGNETLFTIQIFPACVTVAVFFAVHKILERV